MSIPDQSVLMKILGEMSRDEGTPAALANLGKVLYAIPKMSARETAVLWYLLDVCGPSASTIQSKQVIQTLRASLRARMQQIIYEELDPGDWGHGDVSQIMAILTSTEKKLSFWQRLRQTA